MDQEKKEKTGELVLTAVKMLHAGRTKEADKYWVKALELVNEQRRANDRQRRIENAVDELKKLGAFEELLNRLEQ